MTKMLFMGLALMGAMGLAQEKKGVTITVKIQNVDSDEGSVSAILHTKDNFLKDDGVAATKVAAKKGQVTLAFENIPPGTYAILAMHDANDNDKMDLFLGIPKEQYATSGKKNTFGPPRFNSSKFLVGSEDQTLVLKF